MPSGGDWSIHRGGAVFIQDAEDAAVTGCTFNQTGVNGVFLSNHAERVRVTACEFVQTGDSAIALTGSTDAVDGTAQTYPNNNTFARNHIREYGVYGKQTSCFFQSLSANSSFVDNVCHSGPRAGFNFNDGFGGGNLVRGNLLFNHVRETGDHGPVNSWDRQPYLTRNGVVDGFTDTQRLGLAGTSIVKARCSIEGNMIINGYNGVWAVDHDDGSQYFNDTGNVMLWAGCKNYRGNSKSCAHNLILYPGIVQRAAGQGRHGARHCVSDDSPVFANQYFFGNDCVTENGNVYSFDVDGVFTCHPDRLNETVYQTSGNTFYAPGKAFVETCGAASFYFAGWQAAGQDVGSSVEEAPGLAGIVAMARAKLAL